MEVDAFGFKGSKGKGKGKGKEGGKGKPAAQPQGKKPKFATPLKEQRLRCCLDVGAQKAARG